MCGCEAEGAGGGDVDSLAAGDDDVLLHLSVLLHNSSIIRLEGKKGGRREEEKGQNKPNSTPAPRP